MNVEHAKSILSEFISKENIDLFDDQLIIELSKLLCSWKERVFVPKYKDSFAVFLFSNNCWVKKTEYDHFGEVYRQWFNFTKGCKVNHNSSFEEYYYISKYGEKLDGRHESDDVEDESLSIKYLLNKSFKG